MGERLFRRSARHREAVGQLASALPARHTLFYDVYRNQNVNTESGELRFRWCYESLHSPSFKFQLGITLPDKTILCLSAMLFDHSNAFALVRSFALGSSGY